VAKIVEKRLIKFMDRLIDSRVYGDLFLATIVCLFVITVKCSPWLYLRGGVWMCV